MRGQAACKRAIREEVPAASNRPRQPPPPAIARPKNFGSSARHPTGRKTERRKSNRGDLPSRRRRGARKQQRDHVRARRSAAQRHRSEQHHSDLRNAADGFGFIQRRIEADISESGFGNAARGGLNLGHVARACSSGHHRVFRAADRGGTGQLASLRERRVGRGSTQIGHIAFGETGMTRA